MLISTAHLKFGEDIHVPCPRNDLSSNIYNAFPVRCIVYLQCNWPKRIYIYCNLLLPWTYCVKKEVTITGVKMTVMSYVILFVLFLLDLALLLLFIIVSMFIISQHDPLSAGVLQ